MRGWKQKRVREPHAGNAGFAQVDVIPFHLILPVELLEKVCEKFQVAENRFLHTRILSRKHQIDFSIAFIWPNFPTSLDVFRTFGCPSPLPPSLK